MSLVVWLPLNNDFRNQGIKNIELSSQGNISLDNNGKFGKCYYFDGVDDILYNNTVDLSEQCSLSVWFNPSRITSTTQWIVRLGAYAMEEIQLGFYINTSGIKFSGLSEKNYNISLSINTWYHLVMTLDRNKIKGYLNGELVVDFDSNISKYSILTIGGRFDGNSTILKYLFQGKINDFRIYDHCLTQSEVSEIAKGLMLHYSFENPYAEGTTNIPHSLIEESSEVTFGNDSTGDYVIRNGMTSWSGLTINRISVKPGRYYTWSMEVMPIKDIEYVIDGNMGCSNSSHASSNDMHFDIIRGYSHINHKLDGSDTLPKGKLEAYKWTRIYFTVKVKQDCTNPYLFHTFVPYIPSGDSSVKVYYRNSQLEERMYDSPYTSSKREAGLIRDNSGMGNDGTQVYQREKIPIISSPASGNGMGQRGPNNN